MIPSPQELVTVMQSWILKVPADAPLWSGKWSAQKRSGRLIQQDLETACTRLIADAPNEPEREIRSKSSMLHYKNEIGQTDFHALRHTYLSRLGRSGVSAKAMQKLVRHSTVELTIDRYTHADLNDLGSVVRQMCPLPLSTSTTSDESNDESSESDSELAALMVAGFSNNQRQSLKTVDKTAGHGVEESLPNSDSRNPQSTKTIDEDCGCLMAIDKAEREGTKNPYQPS